MTCTGHNPLDPADPQSTAVGWPASILPKVRPASGGLGTVVGADVFIGLKCCSTGRYRVVHGCASILQTLRFGSFKLTSFKTD